MFLIVTQFEMQLQLWLNDPEHDRGRGLAGSTPGR
nr:MAG TPA: hypothetical protein [Bacteriophage sp.]